MKTGRSCKVLLGTGMALLLLSSCSDPTDSEVYKSLKTEQAGFISSIAELEIELKSLQEDIDVAKQVSKDATALQEELVIELDELNSEIEDVKNKNLAKERIVESSRTRLSDANNELAELIEVYG